MNRLGLKFSWKLPSASLRCFFTFLLCVGIALLSAMSAQAAPESPALQKPQIHILTSSPVPAGKFDVMREMATAQGMTIESRYIEKISPEELNTFLHSGDLLILDLPRDHIIEAAMAKIGPPWKSATQPRILIATDRFEAFDLDKKLAADLHAYYINGGRGNFDAMMRTLASRQFHLKSNNDSSIPAPYVFPKSAYYHPRLPNVVTSNIEEALAVSGQPGQPVIGMVIHQAYISGVDSAFVDDMIRGVEARGARALVFFTPMMDKDNITNMVVRDNKKRINVLINNQIMLEAGERKAEFEKLGIPVLQSITYRRGDAQAWAADPQGLSLMDVPFYLVQAEIAGSTDPMMTAAISKTDGSVQPIGPQLDAMLNKAVKMARLQTLPNAEKRLAILFYNYPAGEKNLSASFLNLPNSLANTLSALQTAGYKVDTPDADTLTKDLGQLLSPFYRADQLQPLLDADRAEWMPLSHYRKWFDTLPAEIRDAVNKRWGAPENSSMVWTRNGEKGFVIPRVKLGHVVLMPVPPRGERGQDNEIALYHSTKEPLNHFYMAAYLWARGDGDANNGTRDALIHFGTHGTQEWTPGKERGLSVTDQPFLVLGDVPVVYPFIVDDVGEAIQAKRRGRAVTVSHQTPSFRPAGLHTDLNALHDMLHQYLQQDKGGVKEQLKKDILDSSAKLHLFEDMNWPRARAEQNFAEYLTELHNHLHTLSAQLQPYGLHSFGHAQEDGLRVYSVMSMLGPTFFKHIEPIEPEELFAMDYARLAQTRPYALLHKYLVEGASTDEIADPLIRADVIRAKQLYTSLDAAPELSGLLIALNGQYLNGSTGGDPIRNPDTLPTGRNLYGFDPSKIPSRQAWEAGRVATEEMIAAYRQKNGRWPTKLAFSLWSVETMRHSGVLEAQAMAAMGIRPKWDDGGRLSGIEVIPTSELKRPRVDVVLSATGLYRDQFPNVMKWLAAAAKLASEQNEPDNAVAAGSRSIARALSNKGLSEERVKELSVTRIFSAESGNYGTGLNDAAMATDTFGSGKEADAKLANLYLSRMQYAYGPNEKNWGEKLPDVNLYAENLKSVDAALLARSSNLYGMLTTDDPFQYLGGIGLAVRHLTGKAPELLISNLRDPNAARTETAASFLATELRSRYFHPGWIEGMKAEGYSGALNVLDTVNNFWGWTATSPEIVRDDQWTEFAEVYVKDKYRMGLNEWFEKVAPQAQAQVIERMLEAARKGYWKADPKLVKELGERWQALSQKHDIQSDNRKFTEFVAQTATPGYGLVGQAPDRSPAQVAAAAPHQPMPVPKDLPPTSVQPPLQPVPPPVQRSVKNEPIEGIKLERKKDNVQVPAILSWMTGGSLILLALFGGMVSAVAGTGAGRKRLSHA